MRLPATTVGLHGAALDITTTSKRTVTQRYHGWACTLDSCLTTHDNKKIITVDNQVTMIETNSLQLMQTWEWSDGRVV